MLLEWYDFDSFCRVSSGTQWQQCSMSTGYVVFKVVPFRFLFLFAFSLCWCWLFVSGFWFCFFLFSFLCCLFVSVPCSLSAVISPTYRMALPYRARCFYAMRCDETLGREMRWQWQRVSEDLALDFFVAIKKTIPLNTGLFSWLVTTSNHSPPGCDGSQARAEGSGATSNQWKHPSATRGADVGGVGLRVLLLLLGAPKSIS